jgi:hypothetical protein
VDTADAPEVTDVADVADVVDVTAMSAHNPGPARLPPPYAASNNTCLLQYLMTWTHR